MIKSVDHYLERLRRDFQQDPNGNTAFAFAKAVNRIMAQENIEEDDEDISITHDGIKNCLNLYVQDRLNDVSLCFWDSDVKLPSWKYQNSKNINFSSDIIGRSKNVIIYNVEYSIYKENNPGESRGDYSRRSIFIFEKRENEWKIRAVHCLEHRFLNEHINSELSQISNRKLSSAFLGSIYTL